MNKNILKKLAKCKKKIDTKVKKRNWTQQSAPMFRGSNIIYEIDGRVQGISHGGIGTIHLISRKTGLIKEIDDRLKLFKRHLPYHESDHILNIVYNILAGGTYLQDIKRLRNDSAWHEALGAEIIPDPTTAGDFLRRFSKKDIIVLMDVINTVRKRIWERQPQSFRKEAIINIDGTISETYGRCKQGMNISYKGQWGYAPLVISLEKTREALYIVNRPGNVPSHHGSAQWLDKALDLVGGTFRKISVRGDTDFSLTGNFDRWDQRCTFIFGMDAKNNLKKIADGIQESDWQVFKRGCRKIKTRSRKRPENIKKQIVIQKKFKRRETAIEHISEFEYKPGKCKKSFRMIVFRKTINEYKGERLLFNDIRYFFYISNDRQRTARELVEFYWKRADHENDIEQLKNGVHAMENPSDSLNANWAYMVTASLAWNLKAWYGLLMPDRNKGHAVIRMKFKRFVNTFINIPCMILKTGRTIKYRIINYNRYLGSILKHTYFLKKFRFP